MDPQVLFDRFVHAPLVIRTAYALSVAWYSKSGPPPETLRALVTAWEPLDGLRPRAHPPSDLFELHDETNCWDFAAAFREFTSIDFNGEPLPRGFNDREYRDLDHLTVRGLGLFRFLRNRGAAYAIGMDERVQGGNVVEIEESLHSYIIDGLRALLVVDTGDRDAFATLSERWPGSPYGLQAALAAQRAQTAGGVEHALLLILHCMHHGRLRFPR
jgi:hypothetical protein